MTRTIGWHNDSESADTRSFGLARDFLMANYGDPEAAALFDWPAADRFNWALDWFDILAVGNDDIALAGPGLHRPWHEISYARLRTASDGAATRLRNLGVGPGDRVMVESPSVCELWAILLGILKCGAVCIPVHHGLHPEQFGTRLAVARPAAFIGSATEHALPPQIRHIELSSLIRWDEPAAFEPGPPRDTDLPAFGCFTSGTTGAPKLALHSHRTHGIGHLSSLYWAQLVPRRRHLNVSSPGWAKFFWSSLLVPLTAGATVVVWPTGHTAEQLYDFLELAGVESMCAPTVVLRKLPTTALRPTRLRDLTSVGESVDDRTRARFAGDWGLRVREGFGQTEATAILGELPGRPGTLAVLPGYQVRLHNHPGAPAQQLQFRSFPAGSFLGYDRDGAVHPPRRDSENWQWTGDYADGSVTDGTVRLLGRGDEVYRSHGHLVSPFRIEAMLETHPLVAEARRHPNPHRPHSTPASQSRTLRGNCPTCQPSASRPRSSTASRAETGE